VDGRLIRVNQCREAMSKITRETIIRAARKTADQLGHPISRADFERVTGISQYHIYRLFPEGGWTEVKHLAGLKRHPKDNQPLTDEQLLQEFHRVASSLGRIPTWTLFSTQADISADVVRRRFGGLQGTLKRYRAWLKEFNPASPLLTELRIQSKHEIPPPPSAAESKPDGMIAWEKTQGAEFGPPMNFRGLRHAPINEQGVVFLFGMVSYELGFIVEAVHASYPDCEAKRCVDRSKNRWQRVRIEFEYASKNFREHGHDSANCDLIVCWEHDWPECPLEVLELRRVIGELEG
jgi:hypothetical protein